MSLSEAFIIKPPKKEAKQKLDDSDLVSFVPMNDLGEAEKYFQPKEDKSLDDVVGSYTYFADGDVLLAKITPCFENGKLGIARGLTNGIGFGSSEYIVFRQTGKVLPEYLYYYLAQSSFRDEGQRVMSGAVGHKRVPKEFIENHQIPVPPLKEQQRIVAILDEAFAGIATAAANAEKNLQNARELFESTLNFEFNEKEGEGEWLFIGDVCVLTQGLCINSKTKHLLVENSSIPLLRIKDLRNGTQEQYISEAECPTKSLVSEDDLIYTRTGQVGLVFRGRYGVLHNNCFKVDPSEALSKDYLFWFLQNPAFRDRVIGLASKAAQPDITHKVFKVQKIFVPSIESQKEVVHKVEAISAEIDRLTDNYTKKLVEIAELKQSILQKAFAGELH